MAEKNKLVSVIMSVYNDENNVKTSIESILSQTYDNIEFLIIDDFSDDNTHRILKTYENLDNRIKIYKNNINLGLTKSLNFLISQANGYFIARQDSDDISLSTRIEEELKFIQDEDLDACSSRSLIKGTNKIVPKFSYYLPLAFVLRYKNPIIHGSLVIKKEVIQSLGNYNEYFKYSQDYELVTRLIKNNFKIKINKKILYELNMKNNISNKFKDEQAMFANQVKEKYKNV